LAVPCHKCKEELWPAGKAADALVEVRCAEVRGTRQVTAFVPRMKKIIYDKPADSKECFLIKTDFRLVIFLKFIAGSLSRKSKQMLRKCATLIPNLTTS
jgi:hypothetical protein